MPVHDWSRVTAGMFHDFHQKWTVEICNALNAGLLPPGYYAFVEQDVGGPEPDVITLWRPQADAPAPSGGVAVAEAPPAAAHIAKTRLARSETDPYARKANTVVVRHRAGEVVAVIEVVSPGNKSSEFALAAFVRKARNLLHAGVHLMVIDLHPLTMRDPQGIHAAIWEPFEEEPFTPPRDKPLTAVSYQAGVAVTAYIEPLGIGDALPALPVFLHEDRYISAPLESTYAETWEHIPDFVREEIERP